MKVDHVKQGLAKLRPRLARDPLAREVLGLFLQQIQHLDDLVILLIASWTLGNSRTPLHILKQIGSLLEVPYDESMSKATYRRLLQLRIRSRKSYGTFEDILAIANLLRAPGSVDQATLQLLHPHAIAVEIPNILTALRSQARSILLDALQETTLLNLVPVDDTEGDVKDEEYIKLGPNGPGFGFKLAPMI